MRVAVLLVACAACGHAADKPADPTPVRKDAGASDAGTMMPPLALGAPDLATFQWRKRAGQPAFTAARKAEARESWPEVLSSTMDAVAADPTHLEAQYLLAVALAKAGQIDTLVVPLEHAVSGDFGKWGQASLDQPAFAAFLRSPLGEAWQRRVNEERKHCEAALAHLKVIAAGDLYAFDPDGPRWYRLTRTFGGVIAAYQTDGARIVFFTRGKQGFGVGDVNLVTGAATRPISLGAAQPPLTLVENEQLWIGAGGAWKTLADAKLTTQKPKARPEGPWFEVFKHNARLHRKVTKIEADWDDQYLASAMRLVRTNRVVNVPSPALIDGNTVVWSPDLAHVAFVAQLDDHCTAGAPVAAAFIADRTTGTARELERATGGIAIEWVGTDHVAIAGDHGVAIVPIEGGAPKVIEGADSLITPRRKPRCTPEPADEPPPEEPDPEN